MKNLSEILQYGKIGSKTEYKPFLQPTTQADPIVRTYNNCYGLFTDTHMGKISEDEYVITGSLCSIPEKFDSFLYSVNYGLGTMFRVNGKAQSLSCFLSENGLTGQYGCLNGDKVYLLSKTPYNINKECGCCVGQMNCTADVPVPCQLGEKLTGEIEKLVESSETLEDLQKNICESTSINGSDWCGFVTSTGFGLKSDSIGSVLLFTVDEAKQVKRYRITDYYAPMYGRDREYTKEGTLEELIRAYSYTLEVGKSYENERGNKKINMNPKTIQQLCDNLEKAKNNAARNGYGGHSYTWEEI